MVLVGQNWATQIVHATGDWAGESQPEIAAVRDITVNDTLLAHVFRISPVGYIVVPVLKELPPVKAYSEVSGFNPDRSSCNPLRGQRKQPYSAYFLLSLLFEKYSIIA